MESKRSFLQVFGKGVKRNLDRKEMQVTISDLSQGRLSLKSAQIGRRMSSGTPSRPSDIKSISSDVKSMPSANYGATGLNNILESKLYELSKKYKVPQDLFWELVQLLSDNQHAVRKMRPSFIGTNKSNEFGKRQEVIIKIKEALFLLESQ